MMKRTNDEERSEEGDERYISQGAFETVSTQMLLKAVAPQTSKAGEQKRRHQDVADGYKHRQRRH